MLTNCLEDEPTRPNIELALKEGKLLWLDLEGIDDEVLTLLREVFKIHPLAIEDAMEFDQRPKIEDYDDFVSIVAYGARDLDEKLLEVHCFYAEHFFVSVHRHPAAAIGGACATLGRLRTDRRLVAVYRLLDALVDSMFPGPDFRERGRVTAGRAVRAQAPAGAHAQGRHAAAGHGGHDDEPGRPHPRDDRRDREVRPGPV
jgi:hypothetical protein